MEEDMKTIELSDVDFDSIYVFELNNTTFIGKFLFIHDDEIAVEDNSGNANRFFA